MYPVFQDKMSNFFYFILISFFFIVVPFQLNEHLLIYFSGSPYDVIRCDDELSRIYVFWYCFNSY